MVLPVMDGGEEVGGGGEAAGCHVQSAAAAGAHGNKMEITAGSSRSGKKLIAPLQHRDRRRKEAPSVFPQSADLKINIIVIIGCNPVKILVKLNLKCRHQNRKSNS